MADRQAKLSILAEMVGWEKAAEIAGKFDLELKAGGESAAKAGAAISGAAAATDDLADSQQRFAGAATDAGDAAADAGQKAASAASGSAEAIGAVVTASEEQAAATREAGAASVESGADIETSAQEAAGAIGQIVQNWKATIEAAKAAGLAFDADFAKAAIEELATSIRASGESLEDQKAALEGLAAGVVDDFGEIGTASVEAGSETADQAKVIQSALEVVRAKIAEVDAGLRATGGAGAEGGAAVESSFLSVTAALDLANASAAEASKQLTETGRLPKASIRELAEIIETVNIAMERAANTSGAATDAQVANAERLKAKLGELTAVTNRQVDASSDNSVALQDSAGQALQLTTALTGLVGGTNTATGAIANLAGRAASGAANFEKAKNAISALNLNSLAAGRSAATASVQVGALVAAFAAGATVGTKFSAVNRENANALDSLKRAAIDVRDKAVGPLRDRVDGLQTSLQGLISFIVDLSEGNLVIAESTRSFDDKVIDLARSLDNLSIGLRAGRSGVDIYHAAVRDGLPEQQAMALALADSDEVLKFYNDSLRAGAVGHKLWTRGLRESKGDNETFLQFIRAHAVEMENATRLSGLATAAREKEIAAAKDLREALADLNTTLPNARGNAEVLNDLADRIDKAAGATRNLTQAERDRLGIITEAIRRGNDLTEADLRGVQALLDTARAGKDAATSIRELTTGYIALAQAQERYNQLAAQGLNAISQNSVVVAQAISDLDKFEIANDGTTSSINRLLSELERYVALGPAYTKETGLLAEALSTVADNTTRLEPAQRANIEALIELAKRSGELTVAEQAYAAELIKTIEAGGKHAVMLKERAAASLQLVNTLENIAAQEERARISHDARVNELQSEIALIRAKREELEAAAGASREQADANKYQGASIDFLNMKEKQLQEQLTATLTSWSANSEAKRVDAEAAQTAITKYEEQVTAITNVKTSSEGLHSVIKDGRTVWTNLADDADGAATATLKVKTTTDSLGEALAGFRSRQTAMSESFGTLGSDADKLREKLEDVIGTIEKLNTVAEAAAGSGIATPDLQVNP